MKKVIFWALALFTLSVSIASAHQREVFRIGDTQYLFVIGSLNEPIVVDDKTGVDLRVKLADPLKPSDSASPNAKPVTGLQESLKVEILAGDKKRTLNLEPAHGDPGAYRAVFFPTVATSYTYRVFGTINNTPVDLSFGCNPAGHPASPEDTTVTELSVGVIRTFKAGSFGCPAAKASLGFPEPSKTLVDVESSGGSRTSMMLSGVAIGVALIALLKKPRA